MKYEKKITHTHTHTDKRKERDRKTQRQKVTERQAENQTITNSVLGINQVKMF